MKAGIFLIVAAALAVALYLALGRTSGSPTAVGPLSGSAATADGSSAAVDAANGGANPRTDAALAQPVASANPIESVPLDEKPEVGPSGQTLIPGTVEALAGQAADSLETRFQTKYETTSAFDRAKAGEDIDFYLSELSTGSLAGKGAAPDGRTTSDLKEEREWLRANPRP